MDKRSYDELVTFHGHSCPGLAFGYRMTVAALDALGIGRASDEALVAIVENDACGVDAVQFMAGCTFGKGNLVFRDYGKPVYTFLDRGTGRAVRVLGHGRGLPEELRGDREGSTGWLLTAPPEEVVSCAEVRRSPPPVARLHNSKACDACGERVMESRLRVVDDRHLCIPCAEGTDAA